MHERESRFLAVLDRGYNQKNSSIAQIFRRRANALARMGVTAVILLAGGLSLIALGVLRAPYVTSAGKYGQRVPLQGGGDALFNDDYIRDSILIPNDKLAVGYKPVMPGYKDRITEDEIADHRVHPLVEVGMEPRATSGVLSEIDTNS